MILKIVSINSLPPLAYECNSWGPFPGVFFLVHISLKFYFVSPPGRIPSGPEAPQDGPKSSAERVVWLVLRTARARFLWVFSFFMLGKSYLLGPVTFASRPTACEAKAIVLGLQENILLDNNLDITCVFTLLRRAYRAGRGLTVGAYCLGI